MSRADSRDFVPAEFRSLLEQTKNLKIKKYLIIVCYENMNMRKGEYGQDFHGGEINVWSLALKVGRNL